MTDVELEYLEHTRELLREHPAELAEFENLWAAGKSRHAYVYVMNAVTRLGLTRSLAAAKADENYFGLYMY
jgi:hypothetical protein